MYMLTIPADVDDREDKGDLDIITPTVGYPIIDSSAQARRSPSRRASSPRLGVRPRRG
jgi:hypothetical protein